MSRVSAIIVLALFTIAAVEVGLLGASAAGLTGSDRDLPPVAQRGVLPPTSTPTPVATATSTPFLPPPNVSPPNVSPPPSSDLTGIFIQADPLTIVCNGTDTSWITARLFQSNGEPAPDGTWVYFNVDNGYADPYAVQTSGGYANTQVRLYGDGYYFGPNVVVSSGFLEAGIKVLCRPDSNSGCPISPPDIVSPPCEPTPPIDPCQVSPPDTVRPPCEPTIPPGECHLSPPAISPPCITPTPFVSPPDTGDTVLRIAIDCNPAAPGTQDDCTAVAPQHIVDVVLTNKSDTDIQLSAFNFDVNTASNGRLVPVEIPSGMLDDNPDFNEQDLSTDWFCWPPEPVGDTGAGAPQYTVSFLSCFRSLFSDYPTVPAGASVVLASITFKVVPGDATYASLLLNNLNIFDQNLVEIGTCGGYIFVPAECLGAVINASQTGGGPIATNTPIPTSTHPPLTPTRVRTTPTAPARTATVAITRTPTPKRLCADVDGDGRVRLRDVRRIAEAAALGTYDARYDINQDGRLSAGDAAGAIRQLGRRC